MPFQAWVLNGRRLRDLHLTLVIDQKSILTFCGHVWSDLGVA